MESTDWTPTPKYLLRWACVEDVSRAWRRGNFLEMGAGTGGFTARFLQRGFTGTCYDVGEENRRVLRDNLSDFQPRVDVIDSLDQATSQSFDYLFAFEVLEHIDNDEAALQQWCEFLKPGGRILVSVPAHIRKYDEDDEAMGHYRRYERDDVRDLLGAQGFSQIRVASYGFPLGNFTRMANRVLYKVLRRNRGVDAASACDEKMAKRSQRSGVTRTPIVTRLSGLFHERLLAPFMHVQRWFYSRDWGDGYVISAIRN